jgi:putative multiple sugar transport system ATP-binding protein
MADRIYTVFEGSITDDVPVADASAERLMRSMTTDRKRAHS